MTGTCTMSTSSVDESNSWISWYISLAGHSWLVPVDASFIEDAFNLYGLRDEIGSCFKECLEIILGPAPEDTFEHRSSPLYEMLKNLYGLIHARFIGTSKGLNLMTTKLESKEFGKCPRYLCNGAPVLPLGLSNFLGEQRVKLFCSRCEDVYDPIRPAPTLHYSMYSSDSDFIVDGVGSSASTSVTSCREDSSSTSHEHAKTPVNSKRRWNQITNSRRRARRDSFDCELDGAYFGPTFPHLLLVVKPQLILTKTPDAYIPRVFGFKVNNQHGRAPLSAGDAVTAASTGQGRTGSCGGCSNLVKKSSKPNQSASTLASFRKDGRSLTTSYAGKARPEEDDFVSSSEEEPAASTAKRARASKAS